ncbi:MAG: oatA 3 [Planctomycetota bacterium]|nr:oatA 3 [Planctomycetota bacterium]
MTIVQDVQERAPEVAVPRGAARVTRHVESLDGLRAFAIVSVMAVHAGVPGLSLGWLGVDLFFVLSGFLITALLIQEFGRSGRIDLGRFWGRRFLRLMPPYVLYAGFVTWAMLGARWGWVSEHRGWSPASYVASIWLYFVNYAPQGGVWQHQNLCLHLWSLAVEEQFYFTWPILCAILLRRRAGLAAWVLVLAVLIRRGFADEYTIHNRLDTRGFGIMLGSAVALTLDRLPAIASRFADATLRMTVLIGVATCLIVPAILFGSGKISEYQVHRYASPVIASAFAAFIAMLWYGPRDSIAGFLSRKPLVYLGKISYGMYLYHMLAHYLVWEVFLGDNIEAWSRWPKFGLRLVMFGSLTTAMAAFSYATIERRFLALKALLR